MPVVPDRLRVADDRGAAPAGHVVALRQREHLDADLLGARGLEERRRHVTVVGRLAVGVVVHGQDLVAAGELDRLFEQAGRDDRSGRVVRIVEEHQPRPFSSRPARPPPGRARSRAPAAAAAARAAAGEQRAARVHRVARVGRERDVAGVEERQVQVEDALLGADRGHHLGLGIERRRRTAAGRTSATASRNSWRPRFVG